MKLSAKIIKNYANVNQFDYKNEWSIRAGEANTLYFQLIDLDQDGLRYLAGIGVTNQPYQVAVTFPSIDSTQVITVNAAQADANDSSIWKITLTASQTPKSGTVQFALTEGANVKRFNLLNAMSVEILNEGSC